MLVVVLKKIDAGYNIYLKINKVCRKYRRTLFAYQLLHLWQGTKCPGRPLDYTSELQGTFANHLVKEKQGNHVISLHVGSKCCQVSLVC